MVFARIKGWLAIAGVVIAALVASWLGGRKAGKTDAKLEEAEDAIQGHVLRNEVENRVARDRDARERLRSDWSE
jgi:hypothetical protein